MLKGLVIAFLSSYLLTPVINKAAVRLGAVDQPNSRRINTEPIPNLGGVAIYGGLIISLLSCGLMTNFIAVIVGGTLIVSLGIIDDLYELSSYYKLIGQIIISLLVINSGIQIEFIRGYSLGWLSLPLTLGWLLGTINIINLIDGVDGLADGVTVIAGITLFIFAYQQGNFLTASLILALVGAGLGFLPYNINPAEIFMGDTGSMFLGYILGISAVIGALKSITTVSFFIPVLALGVPIGDTAAAVVRRSRQGNSIFQADKNHLHHQLLNLGLSHNQVVIIIYLISLFLGLIAIGISRASQVQLVLLLFGVVNFLLVGSYKYLALLQDSSRTD